MSLVQILCVYHVGVCYICFDNLLCIVNLHVAGQFRILQHRLRNLNVALTGDRESCRANVCHAKLRSCVIRHQVLTKYCKQLENIFTIIVLGQVLFLALVICLVGFQLFLVRMRNEYPRFCIHRMIKKKTVSFIRLIIFFSMKFLFYNLQIKGVPKFTHKIWFVTRFHRWVKYFKEITKISRTKSMIGVQKIRNHWEINASTNILILEDPSSSKIQTRHKPVFRV